MALATLAGSRGGVGWGEGGVGRGGDKEKMERMREAACEEEDEVDNRREECAERQQIEGRAISRQQQGKKGDKSPL